MGGVWSSRGDPEDLREHVPGRLVAGGWIYHVDSRQTGKAPPHGPVGPHCLCLLVVPMWLLLRKRTHLRRRQMGLRI